MIITITADYSPQAVCPVTMYGTVLTDGRERSVLNSKPRPLLTMCPISMYGTVLTDGRERSTLNSKPRLLLHNLSLCPITMYSTVLTGGIGCSTLRSKPRPLPISCLSNHHVWYCVD